MKRNYLELQRYLTTYFPDLQGRVTGSIDQPPQIYYLIANVTSMLQIFGMAFVVFGDGLLETFGLSTGPNPPDWVKKAKDNKMMIFFVLFMINNYANSFMATGAFEVEYNGIVVHSKLETGRMPVVADVLNGIEDVRRKYANSISSS
mmetsp:Transcript_23485/g.48902  ORF Transcript_23485/g.48902 Transcript_23485/m.48902 type:complete len:147 (+) Transcript_23485:247-687(+)